MKKQFDNTLVGSLAVMFEPYLTVERTEETAKVFSITEVGRKYIKAGGYKFDKQTLRCPDLHRELFIGSPQEFSRLIRTKQRVRSYLNRVQQCLDACSLEELQSLIEVLDRVTAAHKD